MKSLNQFINEKLKINSQSKVEKNKEFYEIETDKGDIVEFKKSRWDSLNNCFEWICNHCKIEPDSFTSNKTEYKIDKVLFKTNKYELKSVLCNIYPIDKQLINSTEIKTHYNNIAKNYEEPLEDKEFFGYLVPSEEARKGRNSYGELIFTKKGILWNYIDDYAIKISDEILV